jgi:hypothetical protein
MRRWVYTEQCWEPKMGIPDRCLLLPIVLWLLGTRRTEIGGFLDGLRRVLPSSIVARRPEAFVEQPH